MAQEKVTSASSTLRFQRSIIPRFVRRIAEFIVGGIFIYAGVIKALDPIRFASDMPRSYETSGSVDESAKATPSKVLWSSLRTTTFHGAPRLPPVPRSIRSLVAGATKQS